MTHVPNQARLEASEVDHTAKISAHLKRLYPTMQKKYNHQRKIFIDALDIGNTKSLEKLKYNHQIKI